MAKGLHHDVHVYCYKWSQLLYNHVKSLFTEHVTGEPDQAILDNCDFSTPAQAKSS